MPMHESPTHVRTRLAGWLAAAACIAYVCRNSLAVVESTIRTEVGISEDMMGLIMGPAFFWSYALAQVPGGALGQRFGTRRCLAFFSVLTSAATAAFGLALSSAMLLVSRIAGGIGQAGLFPCSTLAMSRWFPRTERALASGSLGAAMSIGGAIGAALTAELLGWLHWRSIFFLYAVPGLVWAILFSRWFRETPEEHPDVNAAERSLIRTGLTDSPSETGSVMPPLGKSVQHRNLSAFRLCMICGQQFFRAAGYAFFSSWFATFLQETRGVTTARSGWLLTLPLLATVFASLLAGRLSDRLLNRFQNLRLARAGVASLSLLTCAILIYLSRYISSPEKATMMIAAGAFFAAFAGPCAYAMTIDAGGRKVATVFGTMNMVGNFGAGLLPLVVPSVRRYVAGNPRLLDLCGGEAWNAVLALFSLMYVLAAFCWRIMPFQDLEDSE